jgi:hypothetical protein
VPRSARTCETNQLNRTLSYNIRVVILHLINLHGSKMSQRSTLEWWQDWPRPAVINLDEIREWRQVCCDTHGEACNNRHSELLSSHLDQLTFVDVHTASLITLPTSTPFVALSYVWGDTPMLKAQRATLDDLRKPGALAESGIGIPDTIRDAIHLVKSLGERYLWVDCLCIVQDQDGEAMNTMLQAMAYIYASAEFTIVAADGVNASYGIRGIGGPSQNRTSKEIPYINRDRSYPSKSTWASRGWTYQESLFSRRLLIFDEIVRWICGLFIWHEDIENKQSLDFNSESQSVVTIVPPKRRHTGIPMGLMSLVGQLPDLSVWAMLISKYCSRSLTFETDIERAIAGTTDCMGSTFPGGVLNGLPIFFFDIAFLWKPSGEVTRRIGQPSWSWTGWKGAIDPMLSWRPFYAGMYAREDTFEDWIAAAPLQPLATYQPYRIANSATLLYWNAEDFNGFYRYQALREDSEASLPQGWARHHHHDGDYFTCTIPQHAQNKYSYPLPVAHNSVPSICGCYVLLCTAPLANLELKALNPHDDATRQNATLLYNDKIIGAIALQKDKIPEGTNSATCDFVALSEAEVVDEKVQKYTPEKWMWHVLVTCNVKEREAADKRFGAQRWGFYNVMCIEWDGDTAYRSGLGMVLKTAWDALETKTITFKLG